MSTFKTPQEEFWAGDFGDQYINRNQGANLLASNLNFFTKALAQVQKMDSCIEFGANIGMNLKALGLIFPNAKFQGVEINPTAAEELGDLIGKENVFNQSIFDFAPKGKVNLSLIKGVLIHINPDMLPTVYEKLYEATNRYILIAEYYNPSPVAISYRGHADRLFKRDFAGELMDKYNDLRLVDYGFGYRRDNKFPVDDITWFLLEKGI
ncbi:MAG: pseudaminic acid biosynthesis-associated methylase [Cytophagales bacterium CG12_big_fil_rev_8_21_14_0_65_40_12]|nr:MAG: pseudaminic acid biosynthesis-associated methylase [Cytophagales bacterium CG12_big_fil_rev_8_21_14_0_65_40_12]PIW05525.1 MAG: pseudaminic acid biosynthesis-associated methylase [Cytophagales bacterium CG17_big_fil_post_rev_8_21_14_2_50_40_13]